MIKRNVQPKGDLELIAQGELLLNRVLSYQAAIAVHHLKAELGLDVKELTMSVAPLTPDALGVYRVVCTIVRTGTPDPLVLEVVVAPGKAVTVPGSKLKRS